MIIDKSVNVTMSADEVRDAIKQYLANVHDVKIDSVHFYFGSENSPDGMGSDTIIIKVKCYGKL